MTATIRMMMDGDDPYRDCHVAIAGDGELGHFIDTVMAFARACGFLDSQVFSGITSMAPPESEGEAYTHPEDMHSTSPLPPVKVGSWPY